MSVKTVTEAVVVRYALSVVQDHKDELGEVNLTSLDECCQEKFALTDEEYEDNDFSFAVFTALQKKGLVE